MDHKRALTLGYKVSDFLSLCNCQTKHKLGQVIGQACRRRLVALNVAIVTFDLHNFPLHMPSFSGPKWSMIYMKSFLFTTIHAFRCYHFHFLWHDSIYPIHYTLYEYFVCHASLSGRILKWWDFFYAHAFFQE